MPSFTGTFSAIDNVSGAPSAGVQLASGGGSWSSLSDRNAKTNFSAIDPGRILDGVLGLPVTRWSYRAQTDSIRHIGPMAQDFRAAFNVGEDDRHITTIDEEGVALAAIQGLNAKIEAENAQLKHGLETTQSRLDQVLARLAKLEAAREP